MIPLELVIARYQEPLDWLRRVPPSWRITIYNKGAPLNRPSLPLPNVGREAHTYLHHLVSRRTSLARHTVFVQGHPFDHVPDLHRKLTAWTSGQAAIRPFEWLGFLVDWDDPEGKRLFVPWSKNPDRLTLPTGHLYRQLFGRPPPERFLFFGGAHFSLTADLALRRPPDFYQRALRIASTHPLAAHAFERFWDHLFGVNGIPDHLQAGPFPTYLKRIRRLENDPADRASPAPEPRLDPDRARSGLEQSPSGYW
ncbi:MAG: hypothetical protein OHK005_02180 [Candidatus Methylacidiphilales bacterium]